MASLDWLRKTVDTEGIPCPDFGGKACPGHRAKKGGCAFWLTELTEKAVNAQETTTVAGCGKLWHYAIQFEVRDEAIRTQASLDKTATEMRETGQAVTRAARGVAAAVMLREHLSLPTPPGGFPEVKALDAAGR